MDAFNKFGKGVFLGGLAYAILGIFVLTAMSITAMVKGYSLWQLIVMLLLFAGFCRAVLFSNYKKVVQGANDNLTGSLAAVSILKYLKEADISYDDIEVTALITGSEEAGLRGAKAFAQKHLEECKQIPTMFIGFETLRDIEHITNYEKI